MTRRNQPKPWRQMVRLKERSLLESIQNHVRTRGGVQVPRQSVLV